MNVFDFINATLDLYINLFWFSFPLTIYLAFEINRYVEGKTYFFMELKKYISMKIGKSKIKTWELIVLGIIVLCIIYLIFVI